MTSYLRAANVKDGVLDLNDVQSMNFSPSEQVTFSLREGDVLVTEGSGSLSSVGASAVWRAEIKGNVCFQNTLLRLRPREGVDGNFLGWWARSAFGSGIFASIASGANIYHVSAERVRALPLLLPELDEQRRIADFLDAETTNIDRLTTARRQQLAALDDRAYAGVSEALVPGSLAAPLGAWPWVWLPKLPEDLPLVRLGYVCLLQTGLTVDGKRDVSGDVVTRPYLRVANVQADHVALDSVTEITVPRGIAARSTLRPGDVLMTEGGDLDKLGRGTVWKGELPGCLHQNHVFALRPDSERLVGDYLALMTQTLHGRCYFESTGVKTTNLASTNSRKILNFPIPLPGIGQQRNLVQEVRRNLDAVARARSALGQQLNLLSERRKALITAAVTGQLDVTTASGRGVDVT
ncbi:restriction endonuclease subunit S [Streptomyces syringium]|uniref:restriction endonuclease subunit S n=1 Tax=Streptomyces syringium TaxID=76729 RepID=UPI00341CC15A